MSLRNFDASRITQKNQSRTLYSYYVNNIKNSNNVIREQPSGQLNDIVVERSQGACSYLTSVNSNSYNLMGYNAPPATNAFVNPVNNGSANNGGS